MIKCSLNKPRIVAQATAKECKTIGIFSATATACLKQLRHIIVSIKFSCCITTLKCLTNPNRRIIMSLYNLINQFIHYLNSNSIVYEGMLWSHFFNSTHFTWQHIDPRKKFLLKPSCQFNK